MFDRIENYISLYRKLHEAYSLIRSQRDEIEGLTMGIELLKEYIVKLGKELERANIKLENQPNVIRCKDCDVPHNDWLGCPKLNGLVPPPDFYCACGIPKKKDKE